MKIDFDYLKEVSAQLKQAHKDDPGAYWAGKHVYEVRFSPEHGSVEVFMQWPLFRELVSGNPITASTMLDCLHLISNVQDVEIRTCVDRADLMRDLAVAYDPDLRSLAQLCQSTYNWNIKWEDR